MPYDYPGFTPGSAFGESRPNEKFGVHGGYDFKAAPSTPVPEKVNPGLTRFLKLHRLGAL